MPPTGQCHQQQSTAGAGGEATRGVCAIWILLLHFNHITVKAEGMHYIEENALVLEEAAICSQGWHDSSGVLLHSLYTGWQHQPLQSSGRWGGNWGFVLVSQMKGDLSICRFQFRSGLLSLALRLWNGWFSFLLLLVSNEVFKRSIKEKKTLLNFKCRIKKLGFNSVIFQAIATTQGILPLLGFLK